VSGEDQPRRPGRWKVWALAISTLVGAAVAWGWLGPPAEPDGESEADLPGRAEASAPEDNVPSIAGQAMASRQTGDDDPAYKADRRAPAWVRPTILWAIGMIVVAGVALWLLGVLREVVTYLLLALFFSFAMEPAVNYANSKWHWRRGTATGVLCALVLVALLLMVLILVPTLLKGASAIAERIPSSAENASAWVSDKLNVDISTTSLQNGAHQAAGSLSRASKTPLSVMFGFTVSLIGGLFALFTVGMFVFYMVAEASRFRRTVLSFFTPTRQTELLEIWEAAIEKTGGYFYSKLLLAFINGGLMFIVLRIVNVPGAAALAFFQGMVAAFIPIVGTYIGAIVPILVAFMTVGWGGALAALIYVLIYQQIENYLISPKIQGKTMQLHPAIAFGAALAGGAIGGFLWAFLALPFAATVQASASLWFQRHEVVESELTRVQTRAPPRRERKKAEKDGSFLERTGRRLGSTRGWIRARLQPHRTAGNGASPSTEEVKEEATEQEPERAVQQVTEESAVRGT
jgi:predicted PurR-regulated permease PerM